ncbi:MAG: SpoIID/LytB domain-containing protein [Bacteroidetes bacterium]|nr:SpoIID/LytB domain-containing protein [Bacteroidota bacterium]MBP6401822.1 SpoIID/LytB domain-containing protein [Bacteroidia bacterium]MBP6648219.1 SpoIID/LytB domain-containing protein [Bacteroidia bacterium]
MKLSFLFFISILLSGHCDASTVRVGLLSKALPNSITFIASGSSYTIYEGKKMLFTLHQDESVRVEYKSGKLQVKKFGKVKGTFKNLIFKEDSVIGFFRIRGNRPETPTLPYDDNVELSIHEKRIRIINVVDLEKYVAGVVESEVGNTRLQELLKAQAILARTFVLSHSDRHAEENFSVCDLSHCQAYNSRSRFNSAVLLAIDSTRNKVICDTLNSMIAAPYHSNCGGQTISAMDIWTTPLLSTQSVIDTFCLSGSHATWNSSISKKDWIHYLKINGVNPTDSLMTDSLLCFAQEERMICMNKVGTNIPLRKIREDFHLKSTFFNICIAEDSVLFSGRGFGHGVGLCQEGAMQMASLGFSAIDILRFYFKDVRIEDASLTHENK